MKKKSVLFFIVLLVFMITVINLNNRKAEQTITYFPIDPKVTFKKSNTSLTLLKQVNKNKYTLNWVISSRLDRKAYLRQDMGLLFSNGKLIDGLGGWRENSKSLQQSKDVISQGNALFQALTFHHAELHEKGDKIFSSQTMSKNQLYVVNPSSTKLLSFQNTKTRQEKQWAEQLNQETKNILQNSWRKGIHYYSININKYHFYPLTQFYLKTGDTISGFSKEETEKVVGNLWEGLYKNYFLGIKKEDGTLISPIGSTIPLILLAKDKTHLLVITETAEGEPILLLQKIEAEH